VSGVFRRPSAQSSNLCHNRTSQLNMVDSSDRTISQIRFGAAAVDGLRSLSRTPLWQPDPSILHASCAWVPACWPAAYDILRVPRQGVGIFKCAESARNSPLRSHAARSTYRPSPSAAICLFLEPRHEFPSGHRIYSVDAHGHWHKPE
jgi:hypothetical protein